MTRSFSTHRRATPRQRPTFRPQSEGLEERQLLAAGALDPSFHTTGYALDGPTVANAVQIDTSGNILAAGSTGGTAGDFRVVRMTPGGALDSSFGSGGSVTADFAGQADTANAMAVLADGRIVVAGTAGDVDTVPGKDNKPVSHLNDDFGLVCYKTDGTRDTSFGADGKVTTNISSYNGDTFFSNYKEDDAYGVIVQDDGKIVVGGRSWTASGITERVLVRYNANGSLDTTFGGTGIVLIPTPANFQSDSVLDVKILRDATNPANDKIVTMEIPNAPDSSGNNHWSVAVSRYNLDGTPDTSFGTNGRTITTMPDQIYARSMALQADGSVVVGGFYSYYNGAPSDLALFRYTPTGMPDPTFDADGVALFVDAGASDQAYSVAIQPDGKLLLAGQSSTSSTASAIVARFQTNGAIDASFGSNGIARNAFTNAESSLRGLAVQPDGKVVAVGSARTLVNSKTSKYDVLVARYLGDPAPPLAPAAARAVASSPSPTAGDTSALIPLASPSDQSLTALAAELIGSTRKRRGTQVP